MPEVITIARRWFSSLPPLQIEIECAAELAPGVKLGMAVKAAFASRADLRGADLSGADMRGAVLRGAVLGDTDLRRAVLPKAVQDMRPTDEAEQRQRIAAVAALALKDDDALNMGDWHTCETTHCIAGWAVHQAGAAGYLLEEMMGPHAAGAILLGDEAAKHFYDSGDQARAWLETFLPDPVQPEVPQ